MLSLVVICQAVDENSPLTSTLVQWIKSLALHKDVESVKVIALRVGQYSLPNNVDIQAISQGNRLGKFVSFYRIVFQLLRTKIDCFLIFQGGPYSLLLFPIKLLLKIPIYQWKTHAYISPQMRLAARFCVSKVFTATKNSFPLNLPHVKVIGHGVDTEKFRVYSGVKREGLVTVGRITRIKNIENILRALSLCNSTFQRRYKLDFYGPVLEKDLKYKQYLDGLIHELNLSSVICFRGEIQHDQVPAVLNRYVLFLNFSDGALDKAVLEALACGMPVLSTNSCVEEIIPHEWRSHFIVPQDDLDAQAQQIHALLSSQEDWLAHVGKIFRQIVEDNHSIENFFSKIVDEIKCNKAV